MRAERVFFHIGLHKTGSTWFQKVLFPNLEHVRLVRTKKLSVADGTVAERKHSILIISHEGLSGSITPVRPPRLEQLAQNLSRMADMSCRSGVIVGFREHTSWINSAYAQKAKKRTIHPQSYLDSFSPSELHWCNILDMVERSSIPVFPFLYEELRHDPDALIHDLCHFLGTSEPQNKAKLAVKRENPSPRSALGLGVSKALFELTRETEWGIRWGSYLGRVLDRFLAPAVDIRFSEEVSGELRADWNRLLHMVGHRRPRDFSRLALEDATQRPEQA